VDANLELPPDTILISESIPIDIPIVAALITGQLQTPLCHVALLSHNRKTPNIAVRDITKVQPHTQARRCSLLLAVIEDRTDLTIECNANQQDASIVALDGKICRLTANLQTWQLEAVTEAQYAEWEATKKEASALRTVHQPQVSRSVQRLINLTAEAKEVRSNKDFASNIGAKAQQISQLSEESMAQVDARAMVLHAFVIPFHFYCTHLEVADAVGRVAELANAAAATPPPSSTRFDSTIASSGEFGRSLRESAVETILRLSSQSAASRTDARVAVPTSIAQQLQDIRDLIEFTALDESCPALLDNVMGQLAVWNKTCMLEGQGVIIRSSTNVEDLEGTQVVHDCFCYL
jgi:hypothetical protein